MSNITELGQKIIDRQANEHECLAWLIMTSNGNDVRDIALAKIAEALSPAPSPVEKMDREAAIDLVNRYALEVEKYCDYELDDDGSTMTDLFNEIVEALTSPPPAKKGGGRDISSNMVALEERHRAVETKANALIDALGKGNHKLSVRATLAYNSLKLALAGEEKKS